MPVVIISKELATFKVYIDGSSLPAEVHDRMDCISEEIALTPHWRASETLLGVTQLKIGDIFLLASERDSI